MIHLDVLLTDFRVGETLFAEGLRQRSARGDDVRRNDRIPFFHREGFAQSGRLRPGGFETGQFDGREPVLLAGIGVLVGTWATGMRSDIHAMRVRIDQQVPLTQDLKAEMSRTIGLMSSQLGLMRREVRITRSAGRDTNHLRRTTDRLFATLLSMVDDIQSMRGDTTALLARTNALLRIAKHLRHEVHQINQKTPELAKAIP